MPLLVDVNNVLHVVGVLPPDLAGIDVEELGALVEASRFGSDDVVFVCDGKPRRHRTSPSIQVVFSGAGVSADEVIIGLVDRSTAPRRVTVVSSDREITTAARRRRAKIIAADAFLAMLAEDARSGPTAPAQGRNTGRETPGSERQVEQWIRIFGIDSDPVSDITSSPGPTAPSRREETERPPKKGPTRINTRIHDARRLADIDPEDLDGIDMRRLIDGDR